MSTAQPMAVSISPIFLRLSLAIIFLWAGIGKLVVDEQFSGAAAAKLANLGIIAPPAKPSALVAPDAVSALNMPALLMQPATVPTEPPAPQPSQAPASTSGPQVKETLPAGALYTAADFPEPVKAKRYAYIALGVHDAAAPDAAAAGSPAPKPLLPAVLATQKWPVVLAWTATLTEVIGGAFMLVGLFTRLSALGLASTMGVAMWLTQIGPAVISGNARLGFLPSYPVFDPEQWNMLVVQLALFCSSMAVLFSGAGALSLDGLLFRRSTKVVVARPAPGAA